MTDDRTPTDEDRIAPAAAADSEQIEAGPAPTPFDHPFFLPAVCVGFSLWFGYDTYIHPMEEHMDFNYYGFKVVFAAAAWYSYLAFCEVKERRVRLWVLPAVFAALTAWLGAEAFSVPGFALPEPIDYPVISRYGFYAALAMIPISAVREQMRARRARKRENDGAGAPA